MTLDKADGSTWWKRRGEAEQEIEVAAKELAKHRAQQRRRQASQARRAGPRIREVCCAFSSHHDGRSDEGHPGRVSAISHRVTRWIASSAATSVSARPRSRCGRPQPQCCQASKLRSPCQRPSLPGSTSRLSRSGSAPFGIEVGSLSRATSAAEVRTIKEKIAKRRVEDRCGHAGSCLEGV